MPLYAKIYATIAAVHFLCGLVCIGGLFLFDIGILEKPFKYCWSVFCLMLVIAVAFVIFMLLWS